MSGQVGAAVCQRMGIDRWHLQHGPIDLIIDVDAEADADADADADVRVCAIADCWQKFQEILPTLAGELNNLRRAAHEHRAVRGPVAKRMLRACEPFAHERFITPMAAVAGGVADELIEVFRRPGVKRACINNGGDIALLLSADASYRVGIWSQLERRPERNGKAGPIDGVFTITDDTPVRGVATSGWRGRSFSLGIADSVTVLAANAAAADAAATLIANAVDCDCADIVRRPAAQLKDDTDLGERLVTVGVPSLPSSAIAIALSKGRAEAERWRERGLIYAAAMFLQGRVDVVAPLAGTVAANSIHLPFELAVA